MPSLAEQFAKSVIAARKDEIMGMEDLSQDQKVEALELLYDKALNEKFVNTEDAEVSKETLDKIKSSDKDYYSNIERISFQTKKDYDTLIKSGFFPDRKDYHSDEIRNAELERKGVVTNQELPFDDTKLGFGISKFDDTKKMLSDHFKKPVHLMKDGEDLIYFNPESKKLTKVNYGLGASAGYAIPAGMDIASSFVMTNPQGAVAKTVLKEAGLSGIFTAAGEAIRLGIGKGMGWNDVTSEQYLGSVLKEGATSTALTGVFGGVVAAAKGLKNFFEGGIYTLDEAKKYFKNTDEANAALDEVNKILKEGGSEKEVKGTLGQKTAYGDGVGDANIMSTEESLSTSENFANRMAQRKMTDQQGLSEAADVINRAEDVAPGSKTLQQMAREQTGEMASTVERIIARNTDEVQKRIHEIGKVEKANVGEPTAKYIEEKKIAAKNGVDEVWENLKIENNLDPTTRTFGIDIPYGQETAKLQRIYERQAKTAQTTTGAGTAGGVFKQQKQVQGGAPKPADTGIPVMDRIAARRAQAKAGKPVGKQSQDLNDVNEELRDLRSELADIQSGKGKGRYSETRTIDVIKAKEKDRATALIAAGREDLLEDILAAEKATKAYHDMYTRSAAAGLMEKTANGVPKIKSSEFVDKMLGQESRAWDDLADIIGDDMRLVSMWKEGIANHYKKTAFDEVTGKFNEKASKKWFDKHNKQLVESGFFSGNEVANFTSTGKFVNRVADEAKVLEQFIDRANKKWGAGVLKSADPQGLAKFITGEGGSWYSVSGQKVSERLSKIKYVKNMTANNKPAWTRIQNDFKQSINESIKDPTSGYINHKALAKWVNEADNAKVVKEMLGEPYFNNLKKISEVANMLNAKGKLVSGKKETKGMIQAVRAAIAPPLTARGRAFTAGLTFHSAKAQEKLADAVLDERTLKEVAELSEHSVLTRRLVEKAASLGFKIPDDNIESEK